MPLSRQVGSAMPRSPERDWVEATAKSNDARTQDSLFKEKGEDRVHAGNSVYSRCLPRYISPGGRAHPHVMSNSKSGTC